MIGGGKRAAQAVTVLEVFAAPVTCKRRKMRVNLTIRRKKPDFVIT
jgi:hypothetical protein